MRRGVRTDKLSITLPSELVEEIKQVDPEGGISGFLARAAQQYLAQERFLTSLEVGFGAWKDENHPDLLTPDDTLAFVRRLREGDDRTSDQAGGRDAT